MRLVSALAAAALPTAFLLSACNRTSDPTPAPTIGRDTTRALVVSGVTFDRDTKTIRGEIRNYKTYPYDSVLVVLDVVGNDLRSLATFRDSVATIAPDSTWRFSRVLDVAQPDSAVQVKVTRYAGTARGQARSDVSPGALIPIPTLGR